jgi:hypothetical protein
MWYFLGSVWRKKFNENTSENDSSSRRLRSSSYNLSDSSSFRFTILPICILLHLLLSFKHLMGAESAVVGRYSWRHHANNNYPPPAPAPNWLQLLSWYISISSFKRSSKVISFLFRCVISSRMVVSRLYVWSCISIVRTVGKCYLLSLIHYLDKCNALPDSNIKPLYERHAHRHFETNA